MSVKVVLLPDLLRIRKDQVAVLPVGKNIEAGADTGIIIPIPEDLAHDHHKDSVKAASIITVINTAVSHSPKTSH